MDGVMVYELAWQAIASEFESHCVPHVSSLVQIFVNNYFVLTFTFSCKYFISNIKCSC